MKRSPAATFWLSLLPGLGHLYLGQLQKGILFAIAAFGLIRLAGEADGAILLVFIVWLYSMLDAHRSAQEINRAIDAGIEPAPTGMALNKYWGWGLIAAGILLTLVSRGTIDVDAILEFWPVVLILLGIRILWRPAAPAVAPSSTAAAPPPPLAGDDLVASPDSSELAVDSPVPEETPLSEPGHEAPAAEETEEESEKND